MAFLTVKKKPAIVYILKLYVGPKDDVQLTYKIGITTRPIEERVVEITTDWYKKYRYFPRVETKRFKKTTEYFQVETYIHRKYKEYQWIPDKKCDGSTELFRGIDEDELLEVYEEIMKDPIGYMEASSVCKSTDKDEISGNPDATKMGISG